MKTPNLSHEKLFKNQRQYPQIEYQQIGRDHIQSYSNPSRILPQWKQKQIRKKMKKQIYGEHYNYQYFKPNQMKMYRMQQEKNTEIQKANRLLLEKIQSIFKRSSGRRIAMGQSEVVVQEEYNDPSKIQSNSIHEMKNHYRFQQMKEDNSMHDNVIQKTNRNKSLSKKNREGELIGSMGSLNRGIEQAKIQMLRQEKLNLVRADQGQLNRNLVKLSQIQQSVIQKRKRVQTQMYIQPNSGNMTKIKNSDSRKQLSQCRNMKTSPIQYTNTPQQPQSNRKFTCNINQNSKTPLTNSPLGNMVQNKSQSYNGGGISRIMLYKGENIRIGCKNYSIEIFVEKQAYTILARSLLPNGKLFQELIKVPYKDYQEIYRTILGYNHEKMIDHLKVKPGNELLQIQGFDSKYMDVFQHGEVEIPIRPQSQRAKGVVIHFNNHQNDILEEIEVIKTGKKEKKEQQRTIDKREKAKKFPQFNSNLFNIQIQPAQKPKVQQNSQPNLNKNKNLSISKQLSKQIIGNEDTNKQKINPQEADQFSSDISQPEQPQQKKLLSKETTNQAQFSSNNKQIKQQLVTNKSSAKCIYPNDEYIQQLFKEDEIISDNQ